MKVDFTKVVFGQLIYLITGEIPTVSAAVVQQSARLAIPGVNGKSAVTEKAPTVLFEDGSLSLRPLSTWKEVTAFTTIEEAETLQTQLAEEQDLRGTFSSMPVDRMKKLLALEQEADAMTKTTEDSQTKTEPVTETSK